MDQPPHIPETTSPAAGAPTTSLAARLFNVFATPADVFDEVKAAPSSTANWLVPALILILVGWLGAGLIFSQDSIRNQLSEVTEKAIEKQVEKGKLTKQQAESAQQVAEKTAVIGGIIGAGIVPVFVAFGTVFFGGLIVWLAGNKGLQGSFTYMKGVEVAGLASMVGVLGEIVRILLVVGLGNLFASPSLALLMKDVDPQSTMFGVLSVFNLFLFWELGVRSLGLARLTGASFGKAVAWVFGVWAAITGLLMGIGFAMRAAFGS